MRVNTIIARSVTPHLKFGTSVWPLDGHAIYCVTLCYIVSCIMIDSNVVPSIILSIGIPSCSLIDMLSLMVFESGRCLDSLTPNSWLVCVAMQLTSTAPVLESTVAQILEVQYSSSFRDNVGRLVLSVFLLLHLFGRQLPSRQQEKQYCVP